MCVTRGVHVCFLLLSFDILVDQNSQSMNEHELGAVRPVRHDMTRTGQRSLCTRIEQCSAPNCQDSDSLKKKNEDALWLPRYSLS